MEGDRDDEDLQMPESVKKILEQRMEETAKDKQQQFNPSDMSLDQFKKNFGQQESRNSASRSNKPIQTELAKRTDSTVKQQIRILSGNEEGSDDDDEILGRHEGGEEELNEDFRKSFGKRSSGQLAQLKAKLSLQEELGALKSELREFD